VAAGVALASPATAAGFWLYEMGTPDLGSASAGRAAAAKSKPVLCKLAHRFTRRRRQQK
jgi:hypothetical protein